MTAIAIVGMGCRFAGAPDLTSYWEQALAGRDGFGPIPPDRWTADTYYDANKRNADKSYAPNGAFIDDVRSFPALALGIPPRRVEVMDPQQRFALEVALQAIQDAGYRARELPRRTGVFIGLTATEYRVLQAARILAQEMANGAFGDAPVDSAPFALAVNRIVQARPFTAPGSLGNMSAAIIAQELDLHGPAYAVDAACASAMIAVADAVSQLRSGAIDAAVAGGVYLCLTPEHHLAFSRIGAISASGHCRPFDARADGFVQGDGAGAVVLKRLDDALAAGDRVYAVLHGIAVNNDGAGDGPMAPVKDGQAECIRAAWADARTGAPGQIDPADLAYLETHGTGTEVGDATELRGLELAFDDAMPTRVALGSSKANVGHTMSAAGIAGLIRAALAVHHRTLPPMAGFESAKAELGLDAGPFFVPTASTPWAAPRRLAAVSSFGFGGTNAHCVIGDAESAVAARSPIQRATLPHAATSNATRPLAEPAQLITLSAPSMPALQQLARQVATQCSSDTNATLAGVARTLSVRKPLAARLALVTTSTDDLIARIMRFADGDPDVDVQSATVIDTPKLAFLYPGQGAQRVGMLREARARFPTIRAAIAMIDVELVDTLATPVSHLLYPEERPGPVSDATAAAELTATEHCQPAMFACSVALTAWLADVGVTPDVVTGHSLGEFNAAAAAGVAPVGDLARYVTRRGLAMAGVAGDHGAMAAMMTDRATAESLLVEGAVIANINHPRQIVISGFTHAVRQVIDNAAEAGVQAKPLVVSHAFHSDVFAQLDASALLGDLTLNAPVVPVASGIQARPYADAADAKAVFLRHATSPVDFVGALEQCQSLGATVFVQVGAGGPLASFARGVVGSTAQAVITLGGRDDHDGGRSLLEGLAHLFTLGVNVDTRPLTGSATPVTLPPEQLPREVYWAIKDVPQKALTIHVSDAAGVERAPHEQQTEVISAQERPPPSAAEAGRDPILERDAIVERVIAVVAKVSAYPTNAVKPSMALTEDLGFDSLMVGDLATGLAEAFPGIGGIPQELLINRPTVQVLVDFVRTAGKASTDSHHDTAPVSAWSPVWRTAPLPPASGHATHGEALSGKRALVISDGAAATSAAMMRALTEAGVTTHAITVDALQHAAPDADADVLIWCAPSDQPSVGAVLAGEAPRPAPEAAFIAALARFADRGRQPDLLVVVPDNDPWAEALAGAARAAAREWASARVRVVHVARPPTDLGTALVAELVSDDRTRDVRLDGSLRQVRGFDAIVMPDPSVAPITSDDVALITGGTRGIGALMAERLVARGARVVLLGRGDPSERAQALRDASPDRVFLARADVTDEPALRDALHALPPVTVLVHAAGLLADGPLGTVDAERGAAAYAVKLDGLLASVRATRASLRRVLAIGSWAGRFGSRHQAHYASANAALAAVVAQLPQLSSVTAEFGPWSDSEMARTIPAPVQAALRAEGVDFVSDDAGLDALIDDLDHNAGVSVRGRRVPFTTRTVTITHALSVATHPYLADHAIDGTPVLPLAAAVDLMAHAANVPAPFEVLDLTLYQGVTVNEPVTLSVIVEGDRVELRLSERRALAYRATIRPLTMLPDDPGAPAGGVAPELSLAAFYGGLTFHGPLLQGLTSIAALGDDFVRGTLRPGTPTAWSPSDTRAAFTVDPLALDSVMQLSGYVAWVRYQRAGTPVGIKRLVQLRPLPAGEVHAEARFHDDAADGDRFRGDLYLRDSNGTLLLVAEGTTAELRAAATPGLPEDVSVAPEDEPLVIKPDWVDFNKWQVINDLAMRVEGAKLIGLRNPYFNVHQGTARDTTVVDGRELINFSSYNYLGFSGDSRVLAAVHEAVDRYGTSVSASRVASGERPFHQDLEKLLAKCQGSEDAIVFTSGHATNVTTIGHLFGKNDLILHDEFIHDSGMQGIKLSGAARRGFRHDDPDHLEEQLRELRKHYQRVLILVEGVYSMDGDVATLPQYISLKKKYGCLLMVDEAHSFGVIGQTGCGIAEHFGVAGDEIDLWMGTLSKSVASCGGWIAGKRSVINYLRYSAPGFVYSAGLTAANGVAALKSLELMLEEPWRVIKLQQNAKRFQTKLAQLGVDTGPANGESGVVPAITGNSMHALMLSQRLGDQGINVQPIVYPAVPDDASRLRFFLSSTHSDQQLDHTANAVAETLATVRAEFKLGK